MDWQSQEKLLWEAEVERSRRDYDAALHDGSLALTADRPEASERARLLRRSKCLRELSRELRERSRSLRAKSASLFSKTSRA